MPASGPTWWTVERLADVLVELARGGRAHAAGVLSGRWGRRLTPASVRQALRDAAPADLAAAEALVAQRNGSAPAGTPAVAPGGQNAGAEPPVARSAQPGVSGHQGAFPDQDAFRDRERPPYQETPSAPEAGLAVSEVDLLRDDVRRLTAELTRLRGVALTEERVRRELLGMAERPLHPPAWVAEPKLAPDGLYGTPVLFLSDQHLGEVVDPDQVRGVNRYDLEVARRRWRRTVETAIALCHNFLARPHFDGIVCAFGGDGVSGDIHEELSATNECEIGPAVLELADLIVWTARELQRAFGKVFIPAVVGNHPRMTHKPRAKGAAFTNADWLAYSFAERELRGTAEITWQIPSGSDAHFSVYGHRFVLTHGNQFRGGDGIIGPLGPVFRGDNKKRARDAQVGQAYDTLMVAHFHQLRMDSRIVMNGSLKGYDEWAAANNFPFERPAQALFVVHPQMGITFSMPVLAEEPMGRPP